MDSLPVSGVIIPLTVQLIKLKALLLNPLLDFDQLVLLKRRRGQLGLPVNHKCNSGIKQTGYDNQIALLSLARPDLPVLPNLPTEWNYNYGLCRVKIDL